MFLAPNRPILRKVCRCGCGTQIVWGSYTRGIAEVSDKLSTKAAVWSARLRVLAFGSGASPSHCGVEIANGLATGRLPRRDYASVKSAVRDARVGWRMNSTAECAVWWPSAPANWLEDREPQSEFN